MAAVSTPYKTQIKVTYEKGSQTFRDVMSGVADDKIINFANAVTYFQPHLLKKVTLIESEELINA